MITIQSGKLIIPEQDRFVGFAGDSPGAKRIVIPNHGSDSGSYTLCLRFDDDFVKVIPLAKSLSGSDLILTWIIQSAHLHKAGIVMAQIKSVDSDDVILHTSCDYFIVAQTAEASDDAEEQYVSREELEERMTAYLNDIRESAPYIGEDEYWYVYDIQTESFVRSVRATPEITIDNSMISGSANPVESRAIQAYVHSAVDGKVNKSTTVAGLALTDNISRGDLADSISGIINPRQVVDGVTLGYGGQFGKSVDGDPVMCTLGNTWVQLALADDVYTKSEIDGMIGDVETLLSAI